MINFQKVCAIFVACCLLILAIGFSYKIGHKIGYRKGYEAALNEPHQIDTLWRTDTLVIDNPTEIVRWRDRLIYVPVTEKDTISIHDTTYIALQFEKVEYSDSTYRAIVSGFQPRLDEIMVYPKTAYITNTIVDKKRWSFSITAGPGLVWNQNGFHGGIGVMGGFGYNF